MECGVGRWRGSSWEEGGDDCSVVCSGEMIFFLCFCIVVLACVLCWVFFVKPASLCSVRIL